MKSTYDINFKPITNVFTEDNNKKKTISTKT